MYRGVRRLLQSGGFGLIDCLDGLAKRWQTEGHLFLFFFFWGGGVKDAFPKVVKLKKLIHKSIEILIIIVTIITILAVGSVLGSPPF